MDERHEFQFDGVYLPRPVIELIFERKLGKTDILIYAMVVALQGKNGCFASNEYLSVGAGVVERNVRESISKMKRLGLIKQVGFDGKRRYLKVLKDAEGTDSVQAGVTSGVRSGGTEIVPHKNTQLKPILPEASTPSGGHEKKAGFGLVEPPPPPGKATEEDRQHAATLEATVRRHLGPGRQINAAAWAEHFRLLRTQDNYPPERIAAVLAWYGKNIGGQFVPQAFSGESFRRKFLQLDRQAGADLAADPPPTEEALRVVGRLRGMGWPKGSEKELPAAVQRSLDAYRSWCKRVYATIGNLARDNLVEDLGPWRTKLERFGRWFYEGKQAAPEHFVQMHFTEVHGRVARWEAWGGDLRPFVFDPNGKDWDDVMHAAAAEYHGGVANDYWTRFKEVMASEINEA